MTPPSFLLKVLINAAFEHVYPCMSTFFSPLSCLKRVSIDFFVENQRDPESKANYSGYEMTYYSKEFRAEDRVKVAPSLSGLL